MTSCSASAAGCATSRRAGGRSATPSSAPRTASSWPRRKPRSSPSPRGTPCPAFRSTSLRSCRPHPIPFVCSAALALLLAVGPRPLPAQQADEALVGQLARLLAASDARVFDAAALRDGVAAANFDVRRQAALAVGRIGDPQGVDLLLPLLTDPVESVRAAAAFPLRLPTAPRGIEPLITLVRAGAGSVAPAEAVTAIAKIGGEAGPRPPPGNPQPVTPRPAPPPPVAAA